MWRKDLCALSRRTVSSEDFMRAKGRRESRRICAIGSHTAFTVLGHANLAGYRQENEHGFLRD
jgi:hypothetical protein